MRGKPGMRGAVAGLLLLAAGSGAAAQRGGGANALDTIEPGEWRLTSDEGAERRLCIADRWVVLQLRHGSTPCQHFVVEKGERSVTIRYTCPGRGHGRTRVTVETPRLMQIETQGVADGAPFADRFEARRTGSCG